MSGAMVPLKAGAGRFITLAFCGAEKVGYFRGQAALRQPS